MSKTIPAALLTHLQSNSTSLAYLLTVTRSDATVLRFTSCDQPLTVSAQLYSPGLSVTSIAQSEGLAVNNLELTVLYDAVFLKPDFLAGRWDNARWALSECNWASPGDGVNIVGQYVTGDVKPLATSCVIELRALGQFLQQPVGEVTSRLCRARFADFPTAVAGNLCGKNAAAATVTGTITTATSAYVMRDSARTEALDWFGEGILTFTSGANIGLAQKVKDYAADGTFTFSLPFPFPAIVGDAYSVIAGCRKRLTEDCKTKHANVLNFQGEPHIPGADLSTASPTVNA